MRRAPGIPCPAYPHLPVPNLITTLQADLDLDRHPAPITGPGFDVTERSNVETAILQFFANRRGTTEDWIRSTLVKHQGIQRHRNCHEWISKRGRLWRSAAIAQDSRLYSETYTALVRIFKILRGWEMAVEKDAWAEIERSDQAWARESRAAGGPEWERYMYHSRQAQEVRRSFCVCGHLSNEGMEATLPPVIPIPIARNWSASTPVATGVDTATANLPVARRPFPIRPAAVYRDEVRNSQLTTALPAPPWSQDGETRRDGAPPRRDLIQQEVAGRHAAGMGNMDDDAILDLRRRVEGRGNRRGGNR